MATKADYAPKTSSKPAPTRKPPAKRHAPTNHKTPLEPTKRPLAGWVWLLAGLLIGLFVAMLIYLSDQGPKQPRQGSSAKAPATPATAPAIITAPKAAPATPPQPVTKPQPKAAAPAPAPVVKPVEANISPTGVHYEYHRIFKESTIEIPAAELQYQTSQSAKEIQTFVIQAGSFRQRGDAESLLAELFLLNFDPRIERADGEGGQEWHRIMLGPFPDRRALDQARRRLQDNNINFITLKRNN